MALAILPESLPTEETRFSTSQLLARFNCHTDTLFRAAKLSGVGLPEKVGKGAGVRSWTPEHVRKISAFMERGHLAKVGAAIPGYARLYEAALRTGDRIRKAEAECDLVAALMDAVHPHKPVVVDNIQYWYGIGDEPDLYRRPLARYAPYVGGAEP